MRKQVTIAAVDFRKLEAKLIRSPGADWHLEAARALFGVVQPTPEQRRLAKSWNMMKAYSATSDDVARALGLTNRRVS